MNVIFRKFDLWNVWTKKSIKTFIRFFSKCFISSCLSLSISKLLFRKKTLIIKRKYCKIESTNHKLKNFDFSFDFKSQMIVVRINWNCSIFYQTQKDAKSKTDFMIKWWKNVINDLQWIDDVHCDDDLSISACDFWNDFSNSKSRSKIRKKQ